MANIILFDNENRDHLLPLTFTRPMAELRIGILTVREKWEKWLGGGTTSYITQDYLSEKYPIHIEEENLVINAGILPNANLVQKVKNLRVNQALLLNEELIAARLDGIKFEQLMNDEEIEDLEGISLDSAETQLLSIERLWDFLKNNDAALRNDFELLTKGRFSRPISSTNRTIGAENIFLEEGVKMECCILNATDGPIYIGKNAEIMEGSMLRGPISIGADAIVKMGAKIYGATTIGPGCRAGGEIARSILFSNSNKGHDGFLGDAVLGEWCNLGADTNNSNLKNNYAEVKLWSHVSRKFEPTGMQFCGLIMGDHSKTGINTMLNTGTVVGVGCNIFGAGYPRNYIPSFAWGGILGYQTWRLSDFFETAETVIRRRKAVFSDFDKRIMKRIFEETSADRAWEKRVEVANN
jgi:UDP-N-acetylglucosamine diphosphorylase/glucosamine-1-phosphate N-acetyltransferase